MYRDSLKLWLETIGELEDGLKIEGVASLGKIAPRLKCGDMPKLLMLDLHMPGMNGVESVQEIHGDWPELPILMVSASHDPLVIRGCIEAGASGFVSKCENGRAVLQAIRQVLQGNCYIPSGALGTRMPHFSRKQVKMLYLISEGMGNRDIAARIHLSEGTVKQYVHDIMAKLGVDNRLQCALRARQMLGLGD